MVMQAHKIKDRLREAGCRATSPRIAILSLLMQDKSHPAVDDIYHRVREDLPAISLSTVYETIDKFVELGLCQRVEGPGQPARVDGNPDVHAHARCVHCGKIIDLDESRFPPPTIPRDLVEGFKLNSAQLMYEGTCGSCQISPSLDWSV